MISKDYLVWIDLEMTGLSLETDVILEIATLITTNDLQVVAQGPHLVIHQPQSVLDTMNSWCVKQHAQSGLTEKVQQSTTSLADAQEQTIAFLREYCAPQSSPLCGNSVYVDRGFLRRYMPEVDTFLHYRIIDVSSLKELVRRWFPKSLPAQWKKKEAHRALDDILESVNELGRYRTLFK